MICEKTDFIYPMLADIYYPIITQSQNGQVKKQWILDRTIACNASPLGGIRGADEINPKAFIEHSGELVARAKTDLRISSKDVSNSITNILITNIRDAHNKPIYIETAGVRSGKATMYEVAGLEPIVGPFGPIEYYKMLWKRTDNQAVDN